MRILLLNQYGAASSAPTGRILAELGEGLRQLGHDVTFLEADQRYGISRRGVGRILHELRAHVQLVWHSLFCAKADAVISFTSPACLAVTAGLVARIHRARHFHWAMDLYPDVGVRLGELRDGALPQFLGRLMRRSYQTAHGVVALDEDMRSYLRSTYGVDSHVMEPFPPDVTWPAAELQPRSTRRWLYSGNFGRAHEIEALLQIQQRLEKSRANAELVLQGKGAQFDSSRETATKLGLRQVVWRPPAALQSLGESLLQADVLVVTRKAETKGLLLPSKLILAELSGRTILWIGDTDGYTALRLKKAGHGVFAMDEIEPVAAWLRGVFDRKPAQVIGQPRATNVLRDLSVQRWEALLQS